MSLLFPRPQPERHGMSLLFPRPYHPQPERHSPLLPIYSRAYDAGMNPVSANALVHLGIQSWSLEGEYVKRSFADTCNKIHIKLAVHDDIDKPIFLNLKLYTSSRAVFDMNIKMIPCPLGFDSNDEGFCNCSKFLFSVSECFKACTGTTVSLPSNAWFGVSLSKLNVNMWIM